MFVCLVFCHVLTSSRVCPFQQVHAPCLLSFHILTGPSHCSSGPMVLPHPFYATPLPPAHKKKTSQLQPLGMMLPSPAGELLTGSLSFCVLISHTLSQITTIRTPPPPLPCCPRHGSFFLCLLLEKVQLADSLFDQGNLPTHPHHNPLPSLIASDLALMSPNYVSVCFQYQYHKKQWWQHWWQSGIFTTQHG